VNDLRAPRRATRDGAPDPDLDEPARGTGRPTPRRGAHARAGSRRARRRAVRRARRTIAGRHPVATGTLAVLAALTPVWLSLENALTNPSLGVTLPARGAEWVREHGGASAVAWIENLWYSHHPPRVGGRPPAGAIPKPVSLTTLPPTRVASGPVPLPAPSPMVPFASPAIAGEGQWHPAGRTVHGVPAIYETYLRPDAVHTSYVVGVAWMDTRLLRATLYSGSFIPGGGPWKYTAPIEPSAARTLVAAFNAGFRIQDANGGYFTQGKTFLPLHPGGASFVIYRNGAVAIGSWGSELRMTPAVEAVRQNLSLLVDNGRPVPGLNANDTTKWGFTLGNQVYVWRSGVGITANGALVYVGGPGLNITDLANLLVRAGAVRAMELDINTDWVNFATYRPASATGLAAPSNGTDLLSGMAGTPQRYFYSWWSRDFFTMSARP